MSWGSLAAVGISALGLLIYAIRRALKRGTSLQQKTEEMASLQIELDRTRQINKDLMTINTALDGDKKRLERALARVQGEYQEAKRRLLEGASPKEIAELLGKQLELFTTFNKKEQGQ